MKTKLLSQQEYEQFAHKLVPLTWKIEFVRWIIKDGAGANGITKYDSKIIKLVLTKKTFHEDFVRTIIHEAVHVMLGKNKPGHGKEFWMVYESLLKVNSYFVYKYKNIVPKITGGTEQLVVYHGTTTRYLKKILEKGIEPRNNKKGNWSLVSRKGHVYLSIAYPLYFAINACKGDKDSPVVVKIQLNKKDMNLLYPDEDFIGQVIHSQIGAGNLFEITKLIDVEQYKHNWIDSLVNMGNVSYKGKITPNKIVDYKIVKNKHLQMAALDPTISIMNFSFCGVYYIGMTNGLFRK